MAAFHSLPTSLFRSSQVRAMDALAIQKQGISGLELMMRAGASAFAKLQEYYLGAHSENQTVTVFCGGGNNGGDGYVIAALAAKAGYLVNLTYLVHPDKLTGDARLAYEHALEYAVNFQEFDITQSPQQLTGVVVDALLGIGLEGIVHGLYVDAIELINASPVKVLAVDVPSGIHADTGSVLGVAVKADMTISFIGLKQGLLTSAACDYVGKLVYEDLGVNETIIQTQQPSCQRLKFSLPLLPSRSKNAHKSLFGHVLIVAGDLGYGGAGILAAEAALQSGAGLVSLATRKEHISAVLARRPEIMGHGVDSKEDLLPLIEQANIIVLGPGLGQSSWSEMVFNECLKTPLPMVVDADGLNRLATLFNSSEKEDKKSLVRSNWVLTPHPGEAARLLESSSSNIQSDRFATAISLQEKFGGVCVLKGAGTLIASDDSLSLCSKGNPAMAACGMGDTLAGIIGALLAQAMPLKQAAEMGVWAHATAGDISAKNTGKHLFASDLANNLYQLW